MRRLSVPVALGFLLCASLLPSHAPAGVPDDSVAALIEKDRQETEAWLKSSPTSYLATVNRVDFGDRSTLTVGRAADNDVRIDDSSVVLHHLKVTLAGDSFLVEAVDPAAVFMTNKEARRRATLPPGSVSIGRFILRLSHQRFPGLIVFDPASPRFKEYKGLKYFPFDPAFRYTIPLIINERLDTVVILSTRGNRRKALRVGWFEFAVGQAVCRLEVSRLLEPGVGEKSYSIFFRDKTSGTESYPMGRYVEAEELPDGRFLLDFNTAYNPACAFSDHYNCPIPPQTNHLNVRIPAGEMDAHYIEH